MIDLYCERTEFGLWNEPFNAGSNMVFLIVAILAWRNLGVRGYSDYWEKGVIVLAGLIGIGSFLFHTFANNWSAQADIIPIWLFIISYTLLVISRLSGQNAPKTLVAALPVATIMVTIRALTSDSLGPSVNSEPMAFNGSLQYLPALAALILFTLIAHLNGHRIRNHFLVASSLFFISLIFRSIDIAVCDSTRGIGTHFIWHLFMGAVVGTLLNGLVIKLPPIK